MRPFAISVIACVFVSAPLAAAPRLPVNFDCSAAKDHFSAFKQVLPGGPYRVTGTFRVEELMAGRFNPVVSVVVRTANDEAAVLVRLVRNKRERDITLVVDQSVGADKNYVVLGEVALKTDVPFVLAGDAVGHVQVTLGGKEAQADLGASAVKLELSCSSGDFDFSEVVIDDGG
jgi:hypothetical protein